MLTYILRRLLHTIPVMLILCFIIFFMVHVAGDPVALMLPPDAPTEAKQELTSALGLDKPFVEQFGIYISNFIKGDFGRSYRNRQPALNLVLERLPASLQLAGVALLASVIVSLPLGIAGARYRNSPFDFIIGGLSALGQAMPSFWVAIMVMLLLAVNLKILPVSGSGSWKHLILPAATLCIGTSAKIIPLIRSNMLDIMYEDYIRTARSKGISKMLVTYKHALKNALVPVVTIVAMQIPLLIGSALITETVFAWPGIGLLIYQGVNGLDMAVVQAGIIFVSLLTVGSSLLADILIALIDPRIKLQ